MYDSLKSQQKRHYDTIADNYSILLNEKNYYYYFNIQHSAIYQALTNYFKANLSKCRAIDVGCGNGNLTAAIAKCCENVVGVDISKGMIKSAAKKHIDDNIQFYVSPSDKLKFKDSSFDFCFSTHLLHHLVYDKHIEETIKEMKRVVKNKGLLVIVDSNKLNPVVCIGQRLVVLKGVDVGNEKLVWPWKMKKMMKKHGLEIISFNGFCLIPHIFPGLAHLGNILEKTLFNWLGKDFIVVAKVIKK